MPFPSGFSIPPFAEYCDICGDQGHTASGYLYFGFISEQFVQRYQSYGDPHFTSYYSRQPNHTYPPYHNSFHPQQDLPLPPTHYSLPYVTYPLETVTCYNHNPPPIANSRRSTLENLVERFIDAQLKENEFIGDSIRELAIKVDNLSDQVSRVTISSRPVRQTSSQRTLNLRNNAKAIASMNDDTHDIHALATGEDKGKGKMANEDRGNEEAMTEGYKSNKDLVEPTL